jgi:heteromeric Ino2p/Ino4p transcription factor
VARNQIIADAQARGVDTSGWELSDPTLQACEAQLKRVMEEEQQQIDVKKE